MSINQHQFDQLTEMGISLWQRRNIDDETTVQEISETPPIIFDHIDLNDLSKQQVFNDILLCAGLSIGEVTQHGDHLDFGLFNWFFVSDVNTISWSKQQLFTPSLSKISKSPELKKQLWQVLSSNTE